MSLSAHTRVIGPLLAVAIAGCSNPVPSSAPAAGAASSPAAPRSAASATPSAPAEEPLPPLPYESELPEAVRAALHQPFTGDLDAMVKRRLIRAGVSYNRTSYFVDHGVQRGAAYEHLKNFEDRLNAVLKTGNLRVHVVFFPMARDAMLRALTDGQIDVAEGQFTVTPERRAVVDFSPPYRRNVNEIVVTAPGSPAVHTAEDLSGREVFVRRSSSYYQSLVALNSRLRAKDRPPVLFRDAPENLEDDDLLEMVNAGLITAVVVDDYLADFWAQVFPKMTLNRHAVLRHDGDLAIAFRKNSPVLARAVARYSERWGSGTTFGNVVRRRYMQSTSFVKNATAERERRKFETLIALFRQYGNQYDLDYLMMAAQGYQESRLDQGARSRVGAIGVMQVMPATGAELKVGDIRQTGPNVHAGVKYIRKLIDTYLNEPGISPVNRLLLAFASYNAGPGRIRQLRQETARRELDPNVWFGNVEQIVSARVGRETVDYVSNIFKYYIAYRLVEEQRERRAKTRAEVAGGTR